MYEDKTLICKECGEEFVFTAGEQEFYEAKGFVNEPQRCKACRDAVRMQPGPSVKCSLLPVHLAAAKQRFRSARARIARCIAASASQSRRKSRHKSEKFLTFCNNLCGKKALRGSSGRFFSFA